MKLGLKLWSINKNYLEAATELFSQGIYHYIELFTVPGSADYIELWQNLDIPYILHAPHSLAGFNPAIKERQDVNLGFIPELDQFREGLNPQYIIFHPGLDGHIDETIKQFCEIRKQFPAIHDLMLVENKPEIGLNYEACVGSAPQEISRIKEEAKVGFCLDVGHAICAANSGGVEPYDYIRDFIRLQPSMYHLSDGDGQSGQDSHLNYGKGNYDIAGIVQMIPDDFCLTIETDKSSENNLDDFVQDVRYIQHCKNL